MSPSRLIDSLFVDIRCFSLRQALPSRPANDGQHPTNGGDTLMAVRTATRVPDHYSAWLEVDLDALAANFRYISEQIAPARLIAVVKANGMGLGLLATARRLEAEGAFMLAVSNFHEGLYLRKHGIRARLLIMTGLLPAQMAIAIREEIEFFGFDIGSLEAANDAATQLGKQALVHLKVETGLGRLGFLPDQAAEIRDALQGLEHISVLGIASHEATPIRAEDDGFTMHQYQAFLVACDVLDPEHRLLRHFSSSNAVPRLPQVNADAVRCQALIWGCVHYLPLPWPLRAVASYKARLVQVKDLPANHPVGYSFRYTTTRPTRLGVLPVGTVDGLKAEHINGGMVLVHGVRCPIIGVCSCVSMVDVTAVPAAVAGDEVVLIGAQDEAEINAVEFGWMGKSSFMGVLTLVAARIPRLYLEHGRVVGREVMCGPADWDE